MLEFSDFVKNTWAWMGVALTSITVYLHLGQNRKIAGKLSVKTFHIHREADKALATVELKNAIEPIAKEMNTIKTYLRLLLDNAGIKYHDSN